MTVPLFDLARTWPQEREEVLACIEEVAAAADFSLGAELSRFEAELAQACGTAHAVGVSSGTAAIRLALEALGAGPGTEVVTVANTFIATVEAIGATGARPVLVDADPDTRLIDVEAVARALGPATVAVVPVHLYGRPAPMARLREVCAAQGVALIEDAAQAQGATIDDRPVGGLGDAAALSFYPTKPLGAMGDGGAVVCRDPAVAEAVRSLRHHGCSPGDANGHVRRGGTDRLDTLQAAVLRRRLPRLDAANEERRAAAAAYRDRLDGLPLRLPAPDDPGARQVFSLFVVECANRDAVRAALRERGVVTGVHYPTPVHLQPAWRELGHAPGDFPVSERLAREVLSLPLFVGLREDEIDRVAAALREILT